MWDFLVGWDFVRNFPIFSSENLILLEEKLLDYYCMYHLGIQFRPQSKMYNFLLILVPNQYLFMWDFVIFWPPRGIFSHIIPRWDGVGFFRVGCGKKSHPFPPPTCGVSSNLVLLKTYMSGGMVERN